ncbi:unnamed protein product [Urochloa humidicola]
MAGSAPGLGHRRRRNLAAAARGRGAAASRHLRRRAPSPAGRDYHGIQETPLDGSRGGRRASEWRDTGGGGSSAAGRRDLQSAALFFPSASSSVLPRCRPVLFSSTPAACDSGGRERRSLQVLNVLQHRRVQQEVSAV